MCMRTSLPIAAIALASLCGTIAVPSAIAESAGARQPALARAAQLAPVSAAPTYADLVDLADRSQLVLRARIAKVAPLKPGQVPGLRPGWARVYFEAVTESLLAGPAAMGSTLRYLADVELDAKGKLPKLARRPVMLFADPVAARPTELRLVAPDAQLLWDEQLETRVRAILAEIYAPDAPRRIRGVRDAIFVPGTLVGEGETQIFLATDDGDPASLTVIHRIGEPTRWGVSYSELTADTDRPPAHDTLTWYRLACFLPQRMPAHANISLTPRDRVQAAADYAWVMEQLGPCARNRGGTPAS